MKFIKNLAKASIVMTMPILLYALINYLLRNISGEIIVQAMIVGSIITALYIKVVYLKEND